LDGTIIELPVNWRRVISHVENLLGMKVRSLLELYPKIWGTEKYPMVSRAVEEFEKAALGGLKFLDDSPQLLMRLSSKYQLGLMTFQGMKIVKRIIDRIGIAEILIATRDDAPTRTEQIAQIVSSTQFKSRDFLVVGDRLNDVYSALKVGCRAVLINRWGKYDPKSFGEKFTVIPNLKRLPDLLGIEGEN